MNKKVESFIIALIVVLYLVAGIAAVVGYFTLLFSHPIVALSIAGLAGFGFIWKDIYDEM